ncbi:amino acid ABC transporter ATP-binding protein [Rickettsiales endosymbiont of Peranema trichophorum]|uniref:amino acid ABC transporter ATP-binding protein n=1 Tax=Rickettsiales endosymbiont of Peranema trichophorum TaxID=2486577 RepID=UPI001023DEE8|nr:ATP-binding cassette domain-containing protein [Rickettsiales endosymbiont of Peranema trichophorum]RZI47761.1 amino acid ABC transporter ATP-binding protein [Rickettsiales endosymbiont of Peranema trichophorum]
MLKISGISKSFGAVKVLNNLSLIVQEGDVLGLAGPSGCGKSTLLRCIQGLEPVDEGSIECDVGTAFMFQDFQLFPHMNVLKNLVYAPTLHDTKKAHTIRAMEILKSLGMAHKVNAYPSSLSGGQKQRVALARSLMMSPMLLLCDEPTSGLDVATTLDVVSLLESVRVEGMTMVIASHDLDFLVKIANRILVLKEGEIVADTNPKTIESPICYLKNYY